MADVFSFRGRAYYGKPGWELHPAEVQEDFSGWRQTKSQNGKAVATWLVKNGYRVAYRSFSKGHEARDYKEWWAKTDLIGEEGQVSPDELRALVAKRAARAANEEAKAQLMGYSLG